MARDELVVRLPTEAETKPGSNLQAGPGRKALGSFYYRGVPVVVEGPADLPSDEDMSVASDHRQRFLEGTISAQVLPSAGYGLTSYGLEPYGE